MAITPVELRPQQDKVTATKGRAGGGKFGTMAGLAAGAALGGMAATGGTSAIAMGAIGGAGAGASLGGMLGESVKPTKEGSTAIERRMSAMPPPTLSASSRLKDSIMALHEAPPEARQQYAPPLVSSYLAALAKERGGGQV